VWSFELEETTQIDLELKKPEWHGLGLYLGNVRNVQRDVLGTHR